MDIRTTTMGSCSGRASGLTSKYNMNKLEFITMEQDGGWCMKNY